MPNLTITQPPANQSIDRDSKISIAGTGQPTNIKIKKPDGTYIEGVKITINPDSTWSASAGPFGDHGGYTIVITATGSKEGTRGFTVGSP
jgi:hypothetical protein